MLRWCPPAVQASALLGWLHRGVALHCVQLCSTNEGRSDAQHIAVLSILLSGRFASLPVHVTPSNLLETPEPARACAVCVLPGPRHTLEHTGFSRSRDYWARSFHSLLCCQGQSLIQLEGDGGKNRLFRYITATQPAAAVSFYTSRVRAPSLLPGQRSRQGCVLLGGCTLSANSKHLSPQPPQEAHITVFTRHCFLYCTVTEVFSNIPHVLCCTPNYQGSVQETGRGACSMRDAHSLPASTHHSHCSVITALPHKLFNSNLHGGTSAPSEKARPPQKHESDIQLQHVHNTTTRLLLAPVLFAGVAHPISYPMY